MFRRYSRNMTIETHQRSVISLRRNVKGLQQPSRHLARATISLPIKSLGPSESRIAFHRTLENRASFQNSSRVIFWQVLKNIRNITQTFHQLGWIVINQNVWKNILTRPAHFLEIATKKSFQIAWRYNWTKLYNFRLLNYFVRNIVWKGGLRELKIEDSTRR